MTLYVYTYTHETERGLETKSISFGEGIMRKMTRIIEEQTGDKGVNIMGAIQVSKPTADDEPPRKVEKHSESPFTSSH